MSFAVPSRVLAALALVALASARARAQEPPPSAPPQRDAAEVAKLDEEWMLIQSEYRTAMREHKRALREAGEQGAEPPAADAHPAQAFRKRIELFADRARGTDAGLRALRWIVENGAPHGSSGPAREGDPRLIALERIVTEYEASPALEVIAAALPGSGPLFGDARVEAYLRRVIARSPHANVQVVARYGLAEQLLVHAPEPIPDPGAEPLEATARASLRAEREREGRALLAEVLAKHPGTPHAREAQRKLWALDPPRLGEPAPDFDAIDARGESWKLSEQRGKVVVLVFWGAWNAPSRELLPELTRLAARHADAPLALLGVNTDGDRDNARAQIAELGVQWRQALEGSPSGPISSRYAVRSFPTVHVLDGAGTLRALDVRGTELDRAVDTLLAELAAQRGK